jgi:hypothetical protein
MVAFCSHAQNLCEKNTMCDKVSSPRSAQQGACRASVIMGKEEAHMNQNKAPHSKCQ